MTVRTPRLTSRPLARWRASTRLAAAVLIAAVASFGCGRKSASTTAPSPLDTSGTTYKGIAAAPTSDGGFSFIAANPAGEKLGVSTQAVSGGQARVSGATLVLADGNAAQVILGDDGLPTKATFGDVVVLFSNYTSTSADLTLVAANGVTNVVRGAPLDAALLATLKSSRARVQAVLRTGSFQVAALPDFAALATSLKYAGAAVSLAGCAVAGAAALPTAGTSLVVAAGACISALVKVATLIDPSIDSAGLGASSAVMSLVTCATGSAWSCASLVIGALQAAADRASIHFAAPGVAPVTTATATRRFVVSSTSLYLSDFSAAGTDRFLGTMTANGVPVSATDITTAPDGQVFAVSFAALYSVDTAGLRLTAIGGNSLPNLNALAADAEGRLWAASIEGSVYRLDKVTGAATHIGSFGSGWMSSGDLTFDSNGTLWAAVHRSSDTVDTLVTVSPSTGAATVRSSGLPRDLFGLIWADTTLYGLSASTNSLYTIDVNSSAATFVRTLSFSPYGTSQFQRR